MPSILYPNDKVSYIARKNFRLGDKEFKTGDDANEMNDHPKLEVFVRNGYVIPVVESAEDLPFQFRRTVMTRELAYLKLRLGNPRGGELKRVEEVKEPEQTNAESTDEVEFDPTDHNIEEVVAYAEEAETDVILDIYALEEGGKNRPTLLAKLDTILNDRLEKEEEIDV